MYSVYYTSRGRTYMFLTPADNNVLMSEMCFLKALWADNKKYSHTFSLKNYAGKNYDPKKYMYVTVTIHDIDDGYELNEAEKIAADLLKKYSEKIKAYSDLIEITDSIKI